MDFKQEQKKNQRELNYHYENLHLVREFSKRLIEEMKELVKAIVIFGSTSIHKEKRNSDVDVMIVLDNVSFFVTPEIRESYKIILGKLTKEFSKDKLHIMTLNFSDYWDMIRKGDPVIINILRYGYPIIDSGIIEPMQFMLEIGKVNPSKETIRNYLSRAEALVENSGKYINMGVLDLYYSVVDATHCALIVKKNEISSPKEMPSQFKKIFKNHKFNKYTKLIEESYKIMKDVEHNFIQTDGKLYDDLRKQVEEFVKDVKNFVKDNIKEIV